MQKEKNTQRCFSKKKNEKKVSRQPKREKGWQKGKILAGQR